MTKLNSLKDLKKFRPEFPRPEKKQKIEKKQKPVKESKPNVNQHKKSSSQMKRRKKGSARGIASYEQFIIQQQNKENESLKRKLKHK